VIAFGPDLSVLEQSAQDTWCCSFICFIVEVMASQHRYTHRDTYLRVVVPLIGGRIGAEEVVVALVIYVPHKATLCLVQDNRNRCIVVGSILVFPLNELHIQQVVWRVNCLQETSRDSVEATAGLTLCCVDEEA